MLLPKLRNGYLAPPVIIILALITFGVAATFILQTIFFAKDKTPSSSVKSSPSPTTDETVYTDEGSANWKTYTNDKWEWKVTYPENWKIAPGGPSCAIKGGGGTPENTICFFSPDFSAEKSSGFGFQVFSETFDPDFVNSCFDLPQERCQKLTIAGQQATKFSTEYTQPEVLNEEEYNFSFPNKSKITLDFNYVPCQPQNGLGCNKKRDAEKLIDQIVSTFKFLD